MPDLNPPDELSVYAPILDGIRLARAQLVVALEKLSRLRGPQVALKTPGYPLAATLDRLCDQLDEILEAVDPLSLLTPPRKR